MTRHNNRRLTGILLTLIAVFIVIRLLSPKSESNISKEFAVLDTASIRDVIFHEKGKTNKETRLTRSKDGWKITSENRQGWAAEDEIQELLKTISVVRIDRLAGSEKNSWSKLYVNDTLGTRITVSGEDKLIADWHIGNPSKGRFHYIRSNNEGKVYILQSEQLPTLISKSFEDWHDKRLIKLDIRKINKIVFNYPADSSFTIMKIDSSWTMTYEKIKPYLIDKYLNSISNYKLSSIANDSTVINSPDVRITFFGTNDQVSKIEGWKGKEKWIVSSSYQLPNYFFIAESTMQNEILLARKTLND